MCETRPSSRLSCKIDILYDFPLFVKEGSNIFGIIVIINGHYNLIVIYSAEVCNHSLCKQDCNIDTTDFDWDMNWCQWYIVTEIFLNLTDVFLTLTEVFLTLTEVFPCFFFSCKANARVKLAKTGHGPYSTTLVCICVVRMLLFVLFGCYLCCSMYCLCVNVYCHRVTTQLQLINIISYTLDELQLLEAKGIKCVILNGVRKQERS
jgi:hypothetical protein